MKLSGPDDLTIKVFADGADLDSMLRLNERDWIKGFTTNPSLMRKAEVLNYENFARTVLEQITDKPVSFEVFSDEFADMARQARKIASWGPNVYVKIPIANTRGESSVALIRELAVAGIQLNITAIMTMRQLDELYPAFERDSRAFISVFAGRIADSGRNPVPFVRHAAMLAGAMDGVEVLWASCREVYNIIEAQEAGCDIITVTTSILDKMASLGKELEDFSLDTVRMFYRDAQLSGYTL